MCIGDVLGPEMHGGEDDLTFWFMIVGGIWISDDIKGNWLHQRIWRMAVRRRIGSWDEARRILCIFPWVNALHDQSGYKLWNKMQNSGLY
jgi:hypothetical protein